MIAALPTKNPLVLKPNLVLCSLLLLTGAATPGSSSLPAGEAAAADSVAVLELFTSQGCSSCPPADALLAAVGRERGVIALAYHVDYWNYIGWTDPFSRREWSERQQRYAAAFQSRQVYTPQLVINGSAQVVGSNANAVRAEIGSALRTEAPVKISLKTDGARLLITAISEFDGPDLDVMVAICEGPTETPVRKGENGGKTLKNDFVVLSVDKVTSFPAKRGAVVRSEVSLSADPGWNRSRLSAVAFVQDPRSMRIAGGARILF